MKPPPSVVDRLAGGSLTRRPKGPFAVSWPRQLGEKNVIIITIAFRTFSFQKFYCETNSAIFTDFLLQFLILIGREIIA